ncbi:MAG: hypothetical protein NTW87_35790 [Planctomycetota bacterium]|nr:hypothetical protein [Planctomycetota bacterium]
MRPATKPASGVQPVAQSSGISGRAPSSASARSAPALDRKSFGLTALKPSEMVAGLDEVAKRAEKIEEREEAKRRAGGKMDANVAALVDDTGARWKRRTNIFLGTVLAVVLIGGGLMMYFANRRVVDVREGNAEARRMLTELSLRAGRLALPAGDTLTAASAKRQLLEQIAADLKRIRDDMKPRPGSPGKFAPPSPQLQKERDWLEKMEMLRDAWGQPLAFEVVGGDTLKITAIGKASGKSAPPEPVTVRLRGTRQPPGKSSLPPEKGGQ